MLKVSRRTLQDYRDNGILPYTRVGGKILYLSSDKSVSLYWNLYHLSNMWVIQIQFVVLKKVGRKANKVGRK